MRKFKLILDARKVGVLLNCSSQKAKTFGVDTRKLWLQAEHAF